MNQSETPADIINSFNQSTDELLADFNNPDSVTGQSLRKVFNELTEQFNKLLREDVQEFPYLNEWSVTLYVDANLLNSHTISTCATLLHFNYDAKQIKHDPILNTLTALFERPPNLRLRLLHETFGTKF